MNQELLNAYLRLEEFFRGELAVQINSNEEANTLFDAVEKWVPDARGSCMRYERDDWEYFPFVCVDGGTLNGLKQQHIDKSGIPVVEYEDMLNDIPNIDLEEVL